MLVRGQYLLPSVCVCVCVCVRMRIQMDITALLDVRCMRRRLDGSLAGWMGASRDVEGTKKHAQARRSMQDTGGEVG